MMDPTRDSDTPGSAEPAASEPTERRVGDRLRTLITGRVYFNSSRSSLDCQIRNLSEDGACLKGQGITDVPDRFRLEIPSRNKIFSAHVRWRRGEMVGVRFEAPPAATGQSQGYATAEPLLDRISSLEFENRTLRRRIVELSERLAELGISSKGF